VGSSQTNYQFIEFQTTTVQLRNTPAEKFEKGNVKSREK